MVKNQTVGSAGVQGRLWGQRPQDWAEVQEDTARPVFREVVDQYVRPGLSVLDVGCGSGRFAQLATAAGANVVGLDAARELIEIAAERSPRATFHTGEIQDLPFADGSFDLVTGFNSFQYAASPAAALAEARRVLRPGGRTIVMIWGAAEECEASIYLAALGRLQPPPPPGAPGPFAISQPGVLEALLLEAGLTPERRRVVASPWRYVDLESALRGLLSPGPARRAAENSGEEAVGAAVIEAITPFRRSDGQYVMLNAFHYVIATAG